MKKSMFLTLMLMITVLGMGKLALPFLDQQGEAMLVAVSSAVQHKDTELHVEMLNVDGEKLNKGTTDHGYAVYQGWSGQWLSDELIPSVAAAEAMPLAEERRNASTGTAKLAELRAMQKKLDEREVWLNEREGEAKQAEARAKEKISQLEQLEARIKTLLEQEKSIKNKKIKRLTTVYEGMKAEKAAPVIAQMDLAIVVKIFSRMSEKQVGKILSFLPAKKAVVISQALTQRIGKM